MTNHVHLLVMPEESDSAGLMMKHLGQRYVQYINRTYRRSRTLWEGRFKSCIAQDETYVLGCYRYIELNPVRASMVCHPAEYRWSSYRANGQGEPSDMISPHEQYLKISPNKQDRESGYRGLFRYQLDAGLID
jgi:putative transposase